MENFLSWDIEQSHIYDQNGNPIEGYKAITNGNTGHLLNIAKNSYTPVSNEQLLEKVALLQKATGFELEGFETFKNGKKVMAYLKNPNAQNMVGLSTKNFLIVGNSHDSSTALFSGLTNYIHRCANMFTQQNMQMRVHHTADINARLDDMVETIDFYFDAEQQIYRQMEAFDRVKISERKKEELVENLLDFKMLDYDDISTRRRNKAELIFESISRETAELGNSLFGVFNGITHYTTHVLKSTNKTFGSPFGHAAEINKKALKWCQVEAEKAPRQLLLNHF